MGRTRQAEAAISNLKEKEVIPKIIKNKLQFFFFSIIVFLLLIVLIFAIISPTKLTGFFTGNYKENIQNFSQDINFISNHSSTYELELENPGKLNSLKLSGLVELNNNSEVRIYLDELLIFDSSKIKKKSNSVSKITGEAIDETSNTETTNTPEQSTESQEPYSETETPLQEESSPSQEESLTENQTEEIIQETNKTEINETSNQNQFNESYSETETPLQEESSPSQEESLTENQTTETEINEILEFSDI